MEKSTVPQRWQGYLRTIGLLLYRTTWPLWPIVGRIPALVMALGLSWTLVPEALAQTLPKTIKIVYPFPAGSAGDTLSRIVAESLQTELGRTVLVENRSGAAGIAGVRSVISAEADGATLLISPVAPVLIIPAYNPNAGYDAEKDLAPISHLASQELALAVGPALPARSLKELIEAVKANPSKGSYGTPGAGSSLHLMGIKMAMVTGIELTPIHYRGTSLALNDVVAGQLPMLFSALPDQVEQHRANNIRILATSGPRRSIFVSDVPTFKEGGIDISTVSWFAAYAPARTPEGIIKQLSRAMAQAVQRTDNVKRLHNLGFLPVGSTPAELAAMFRSDREYWMPVIAASGVKQ